MRVLLVAAIMGSISIGLLGSNLVGFKRDKNVSAHEMQQSAKLRPLLAAFAYEMFKDRPLTGVGLSQYKRYNLEYLTKTDFDLPLAAAKTYVQHNIFLSLLVETGLIGVLLFILLLAIWFRDGWTLWYDHDAPLWQRQFGLLNVLMIGAYIPNGMFHEMSVIPMLNMLMFFVAGLNRNMVDQYMQEVSAYGRRGSDQRAEDFQGGTRATDAQWSVTQERRQLPGA
jgi:O-antigen ligase